jgi:hypothetical protein
MNLIKLPPLNLTSAPEWYVLLFSYTLLSNTDNNETIPDGLSTAVKYHYNDKKS